MSIPVWEVLEGHANTVEGQEHKPYRDLVNGNGQPLDLVGVMRECATILREDYERRCARLARNARSVSPQAEKKSWPNGCDTCGSTRDLAINVGGIKATVECSRCFNKRQGPDSPFSRTEKPLVSSERVTAIKAFRRSLALLEEVYGVKLESDDGGFLNIVDTTRKLPHGYLYDARISFVGDLTIADWVVEPEVGEKR